MSLPAAVDTVTILLGPLRDSALRPQRGRTLRVRLAQTVRVLDSGAVLRSTYNGVTGEDGIARVRVIASDSDGLDRTGFTYEVYAPDWADQPFDVVLPAAAPVVHVEDLVATTASDGTAVYVPDDTSWVALVEHPTYPGLYIMAGGTILTESPDYPGLYQIGA